MNTSVRMATNKATGWLRSLCISGAVLSAGCVEYSIEPKPEDPIVTIPDTDLPQETAVEPEPEPEPEPQTFPAITVHPTALRFGYVPEGTSEFDTVTVTNIGTADLSVTDLVVTGGPQFTAEIFAPSFLLAPGESTDLGVRYTPNNALSQGELRFATNDAGAPVVAVPLDGTGENPGLIAIPNPLHFGDVAVGDLKQLSLTLQNTGNAVVTVTGLSSSDRHFDTPVFAMPLVLDPSGEVDVDVYFEPDAIGLVSGSISIQSDARVPAADVPVDGTGIDKPTADCFADPQYLSSLTDTSTFKGSGSTDPQGQALTYDWRMTARPAGSSVNLAGTGTGADRGPITPDLPGDYTAELVVTNTFGLASDPCTATFTLGEIKQLEITPDPLDFGQVPVTDSKQKQVTFRATGNATVRVTGLTSGANPFAVTFPGAFDVVPGTPMTVPVVFTPPNARAYTTTLTAVSDASNTPSITATGRGTASDPVAVCYADPSTVVAIHESTTWVGRDSFDPAGGNLSYDWTLLSVPTGSSRSPGPMAGSGADRGPFTPDVLGTYRAELVVTNNQGVASAPCIAELEAESNADLWIEIAWTNNDDIDLHLFRDGGPRNSANDCYYANCIGGNGRPWGAPGSADNAFLDLDDIVEKGPENINLAEPESLTYRVVLHDYDGGWLSQTYSGNNRVRVRIFISNRLEFDEVRTMSGEGSWQDVADINWATVPPTITSL